MEWLDDTEYIKVVDRQRKSCPKKAKCFVCLDAFECNTKGDIYPAVATTTLTHIGTKT